MEKSSRTKTALVTLAIGLALNIALGAAKLVTGVLADSTAVTSDALNNLSDAAVSVVTIIATALAARAPITNTRSDTGGTNISLLLYSAR